MDQLLANLAAPFSYIKDIFSSIKGVILFIISTIVAMNSLQQALMVLGIIIIVDYATGIFASWMEHKREKTPIKVYFFESKKTRSSILKVAGYSFFILSVWAISSIFFDQKIDLIYSSKQFSIVELTAGICIANEAWSVIENFKRAGWDLIGSITNASKKIWETIKTIKTGK